MPYGLSISSRQGYLWESFVGDTKLSYETKAF